MDDDLVYIHSNALIENKARFIETVATGRIGYDSLVPVQMTHRLYGSTAVGNGRWRLVSWQSTRVQ